MFCSLVFVGFCFKDFIIVFSFFVVIVLFLFLLNNLNVFLNFVEINFIINGVMFIIIK